jgi:hypothetical protein
MSIGLEFPTLLAEIMTDVFGNIGKLERDLGFAQREFEEERISRGLHGWRGLKP